MCAMSLDIPLKENAVLRETMESAETLPRSVMMSSVMPSLKYSCSGSPLMFANGRTQIATVGRRSLADDGTALAAESFNFASSAAHRALNGRSEEHTSELQSQF